MPEVNNNTKPKVLFLMGPTASGKTDLAIEISRQVPSHLISVDSALVYKGLDIGSAKPDKQTLETYPHALVDIRDPAEPYSAADFAEEALAEIQLAHTQNKLPILVGGTMLYYKALYEGLEDMPEGDPEVRARIDAMAEAQGWPAMHARLAEVDPVTAERLHPNHNQRIQRALEIFEITGKPMSELHANQSANCLSDKYDVRQLAIMPRDRKTLHERIERRLDLMFEGGFIDEVEGLFRRQDLHVDLPSVRAVGYRQLWAYLEGDYDLEEAKFRALVATRNLAKRQLTWMRSWPNLNLIYTDTDEGRTLELEELVRQVLNLADL